MQSCVSKYHDDAVSRGLCGYELDIFGAHSQCRIFEYSMKRFEKIISFPRLIDVTTYF